MDYLVAVIADGEGGPTRPLADEVVPFLVSMGVEGATDEAAALSLCGDMERRLAAALGGPGGGAAEPVGPLALLAAPVCLGAAMPLPSAPESPRRCGALPTRGGLLSATRVDSDGEGEGKAEAGARARKKAAEDGVSLSKRKEHARAREFRLRTHGDARPARPKIAVGIERPLLANGQLKLNAAGARDALAVKIPAQILR